MTDTIVNPTEAYGSSLGSAFRFSFGAYGWTVLWVFGNSEEAALEEAAEWLSEHEPGVFTDPEECAEMAVDGEVPDHTYTEHGYIPSWEWCVNEVDRSELEERALRELYQAGELTPEFNRWDVCLAWYHYLTAHHDGQWSGTYLRLCKLQDYFTPGWGEQHIRGINENAAAIYARLICSREGEQAAAA
jgi:hypothetical protein